MPNLTIIGLGPGTWESLTLEAAEALQQSGEVYVRTAVKPSLDPIKRRLPNVTFYSFDHLYESLPSLPAIYEQIAEDVLKLAARPEGVVYAVPGSPTVGETTVRLLLESCEAHGLEVRIIQGLSFVEPVLAAAGTADADWVQVIDARDAAAFGSENAVGQTSDSGPLLPWRAPSPTDPVLVSHLFGRSVAGGVKLWLSRYFPDQHAIKVIQGAGTPDCTVTILPLHDLDRLPDVDHRTAVYVPPLSDVDNVRTFSGIMQLTRRLRGPGGCPWDREQTHASLKPHLLEEAYEVLDALDVGDPEIIAEELGDLLYQITIHSQVAAEAGEFTIEDVIQNIVTKMVGRHPHVFGDLHLESAQDVRHAWEAFKQRQKPERTSVMEQIPRGLPALPQSNLMQKRAASVGFEWPSVAEVIAKVAEELDELRDEITSESPREQQREELGDILFALVSVARHLRIDPEEALRLANRKFAGRFQEVEALAAGDGRSLRELSAEELDGYWNQVKASTASASG
jgi:tetrapyrrole methylase family protein/MazG family protein